jgi:hypothetical protein
MAELSLGLRVVALWGPFYETVFRPEISKFKKKRLRNFKISYHEKVWAFLAEIFV